MFILLLSFISHPVSPSPRKKSLPSLFFSLHCRPDFRNHRSTETQQQWNRELKAPIQSTETQQPCEMTSETESWKRPFNQPKRNSHVKWPVKQRAESAHSINRNTTTVWHNRWNKSYWRPLLPRILYCVHVDPLHSKLSTWHVARCCDAYHCTVTQSPFREPTAWDVHGAPTDID